MPRTDQSELRPASLTPGFTLIELLLVVGIIGVLAGITIVAINPSRQLESAHNAARRSAVNTIEKALYQYLIDHGKYPSASLLAEGQANAKRICRWGVAGGTSSCVSIDGLVADYLVDLPVDAAETDPALTGYSVYLKVGRAIVTADHLEIASSSAVASSSASSAPGGQPPSSAPSTSSSSAPVTSSSSSSSITGLVGYWKLDGNLADSSGFGNTGTANGNAAPSASVPPVSFTNPYSYVFDGAGDFISLTDIDVDYITISAWVKANAGTKGFIVTKNFDNVNLPYSLNVGGNGAPSMIDGIGFYSAGWKNSGITTDIRGDGLWHHVAGTYDGTTLKYYVDGILKASSTEGSGALPKNNSKADIGRYAYDNEYFAGNIDDVRLYNRALTAGEIATLAGGGF